MATDEEYRRQAAECRRMAENAYSPLDKDGGWQTLGFEWCPTDPKLRPNCRGAQAD